MSNNNNNDNGCLIFFCFLLIPVLYIVLQIVSDFFYEYLGLSFFPALGVIIVFFVALSYLINKMRINKYNKKFHGVKITRKDIKRRFKLDEENRLLYIIALNVLLEVPFEKINSFEWNEENPYFKELSIYTSLDDPNLSIIKFSYLSEKRHAEAKQILAYVVAHHDNDNNDIREIDNSNNKEQDETISDEELRKIIKLQNKRIEELEQKQKDSNNSDEK